MKMLLGVRVEPELKALLQKLADGENRNLSNFVVNAVVTYLKDNKGIEDWRAEVCKNKNDNYSNKNKNLDNVLTYILGMISGGYPA